MNQEAKRWAEAQVSIDGNLFIHVQEEFGGAMEKKWTCIAQSKSFDEAKAFRNLMVKSLTRAFEAGKESDRDALTSLANKLVRRAPSDAKPLKKGK